MKLEVGYQTDPGPRKGKNQDSVSVMVGEALEDAAVLILSDGMGGARAGEVASQEAVSVVERHLSAPLPTAADARERLLNAVQAANRTIFQQAEASAEKHGMGCTIVAALVLGDQFWVASVGDSRAYLIRGGRAFQLTDDHTWVNARVRDGVMTREEASRSSLRHVLDRALGTRPTVDVDIWYGESLIPGDVLLLCSDGLYGVLSDEEMVATATTHPAQDAAERLIQQALDAHTHDNVSVVLLRVP